LVVVPSKEWIVRRLPASLAPIAFAALAAAALAAPGAAAEPQPAPQVAFTPYETRAVGSGGVAVAIADVTGDGRDDVLMTTGAQYMNQDHRLVVFAQRADGYLGAPQFHATDGVSADSMGLATGDLNGDGDADVAVGTGTGVDVYMQGPDGLGERVLFPTDAPARHVLIADMTGDGRNDIVAASDPQVTLLTATGAGFSASTLGLTTYESAIAATDVDGDGRQELLQLSGVGPGMVEIFAPEPDGSGGDRWWSRDIPTGAAHAFRGLEAADVTGDGLVDLIVNHMSNSPYARIHVVPQIAGGAFGEPVVLPSYDLPYTIRAGDMDGDGRNDVVVLHSGWMAASVYLQREGGTLGAPQRFALPMNNHYDSQALALGDLNGDGRTDIAVAQDLYGLVILRQTDRPAPEPTPAPDPDTDTGSGEQPAPQDPPTTAPDTSGGQAPGGTSPFTPGPTAPATQDPPATAPGGQQPQQQQAPAAAPVETAPPAPAPTARPHAVSSPRLALRAATARRVPGGVRIAVTWSGGRGRLAWSVRLSGRDRRGRAITRTHRGTAAAGAHSLRRILPQPLARSAPVRAEIVAVSAGRRVTRTIFLRA
jgi:hypothetical protein